MINIWSSVGFMHSSSRTVISVRRRAVSLHWNTDSWSQWPY